MLTCCAPTEDCSRACRIPNHRSQEQRSQTDLTGLTGAEKAPPAQQECVAATPHGQQVLKTAWVMSAASTQLRRTPRGNHGDWGVVPAARHRRVAASAEPTAGGTQGLGVHALPRRMGCDQSARHEPWESCINLERLKLGALRFLGSNTSKFTSCQKKNSLDSNVKTGQMK